MSKLDAQFIRVVRSLLEELPIDRARKICGIRVHRICIGAFLIGEPPIFHSLPSATKMLAGLSPTTTETRP